MAERVLIRAGCVLTLGDRTPNHRSADVLIDDGVIAEIGTGLRARDALVVDASASIVMPGFVDAHRHAARSLLGSGGDDIDPAVWDAHDDDAVHTATLLALVGAARNGVTTVADWTDRPAVSAAAHTESGLRTVLVAADPAEVGPRTTVARAGAAVTGGEPIHVHVGTHPDRAGAVAGLGEALGPHVTLVYGNHLSDADLDAIAASGTNLVVAPSQLMVTGDGAPDVQRLLDRSIRFGLGVGEATVGPGDMFAQLRMVIALQHAMYFDRKLVGKAGLPNLMTTRDVIRSATIDGARSLGLGDVTGSLEVGKAADVLVLRADTPNIAPVNDPVGAVVWGMDTSNVSWVFVDGVPLVRDGVSVADVPRLRHRAVESRDRVLATVGAGR